MKHKIYISVLISLVFLLAFTAPLNPPAGGWYQQFLPDIGNRGISDIFFLDSLNGWAVTPYITMNDTAYVLKTTNGGNNWFKQFIRTGQFVGYNKVRFLNLLTGYICGTSQYNGEKGLQKTTDGGDNWFSLNVPDPFLDYKDMSILNEDTIWLVNDDLSSGGVFRTTNGGVNWVRQYNGNNPSKIYMYDRNLGFISPPTGGALYRTTNSGDNWTQIAGTEGFYDIKFVDNLTGWKARGQIKKTTDGGLNWVQQILPSGGIILSNAVNRISVINKDTLWGVGGSVFYGSGQFRGMLFRTTNGGINWLFQVPDTTIHLDYYSHIAFVNRNIGWAYRSLEGGVHTTTGGDPIWYTGVQQVSSQIPKGFKLYQNYPNPFNPKTKISYELKITSYVFLAVYNIQGKHVIDLVNQKQDAGTYQVDFSGNGLSSGAYFYKITINSGKEVFTDTKKMLMIK